MSAPSQCERGQRGRDFASRLEATGEIVDGQALAPEVPGSDTTAKDDCTTRVGASPRLCKPAAPAEPLAHLPHTSM
jgi:hypothetical protein